MGSMDAVADANPDDVTAIPVAIPVATVKAEELVAIAVPIDNAESDSASAGERKWSIDWCSALRRVWIAVVFLANLFICLMWCALIYAALFDPGTVDFSQLDFRALRFFEPYSPRSSNNDDNDNDETSI